MEVVNECANKIIYEEDGKIHIDRKVLAETLISIATTLVGLIITSISVFFKNLSLKKKFAESTSTVTVV